MGKYPKLECKPGKYRHIVVRRCMGWICKL